MAVFVVGETDGPRLIIKVAKRSQALVGENGSVQPQTSRDLVLNVKQQKKPSGSSRLAAQLATIYPIF